MFHCALQLGFVNQEPADYGKQDAQEADHNSDGCNRAHLVLRNKKHDGAEDSKDHQADENLEQNHCRSPYCLIFLVKKMNRKTITPKLPKPPTTPRVIKKDVGVWSLSCAKAIQKAICAPIEVRERSKSFSESPIHFSRYPLRFCMVFLFFIYEVYVKYRQLTSTTVKNRDMEVI